MLIDTTGPNWPQLSEIIAATRGLGTAAFGLVDASKAFWGGVNRTLLTFRFAFRCS